MPVGLRFNLMDGIDVVDMPNNNKGPGQGGAHGGACVWKTLGLWAGASS